MMLYPDHDLEWWRSVVRRLATDPRMEEVWRELQRRRRGQDGAYMHAVPEWLPAVAPLPEARQATAMNYLFVAAVAHFAGSLPAISKRELEKQRRALRELSASVRDNLGRLRTLGRFENAEAALIAAIGALDRQAEPVGPYPQYRYRQAVIDRHRGDRDPKLPSYVVELAGETLSLFASPLYGTVAIIASVAFAQPVTAEMVRGAWWRAGRPHPVFRAPQEQSLTQTPV